MVCQVDSGDLIQSAEKGWGGRGGVICVGEGGHSWVDSRGGYFCELIRPGQLQAQDPSSGQLGAGLDLTQGGVHLLQL